MFINLEPDEKIIFTLRRHWFVLTMAVVRILPLFLLPPVARFFLSLRLDMSDPFINSIFWLLSGLWWLFVWGGLAMLWINYYLDFWVVTNQRVISTYQLGLFRREVSELSFSRIQDMTVNVKGVIETFLNYGDLEIRTAGTFERNRNQEVNVFIFKDIAQPYKIQEELSNIHHDYIKINHGE